MQQHANLAKIALLYLYLAVNSYANKVVRADCLNVEGGESRTAQIADITEG